MADPVDLKRVTVMPKVIGKMFVTEKSGPSVERWNHSYISKVCFNGCLEYIKEIDGRTTVDF